MIPPIFTLLSADATVAAAVGSNPVRIYPFGQAPNPPGYPYITYGVITGTPQNKLDGTPDVDVLQVQVDVWGDSHDSTMDLAAAARDALEPHAHMTGMGPFQRDAETRSYRAVLTFDFFLNR